MQEKEIMMDVLSTEKALATNTVTAMHEASSKNIYELYKLIFNNIAKEVKEIFGICYENGWYQLEAAGQTKIKQEITKLCGELNKEE